MGAYGWLQCSSLAMKAAWSCMFGKNGELRFNFIAQCRPACMVATDESYYPCASHTQPSQLMSGHVLSTVRQDVSQSMPCFWGQATSHCPISLCSFQGLCSLRPDLIVSLSQEPGQICCGQICGSMQLPEPAAEINFTEHQQTSASLNGPFRLHIEEANVVIRL